MEENLFQTKDMNLAACLMVESVRYVDTRREETPEGHDGRKMPRLTFIFEQSPEIARIQAERANGTHVVSSVAYDDCLRRLKSIIHSF